MQGAGGLGLDARGWVGQGKVEQGRWADKQRVWEWMTAGPAILCCYKLSPHYLNNDTSVIIGEQDCTCCLV